jgi:hypothetical protein
MVNAPPDKQETTLSELTISRSTRNAIVAVFSACAGIGGRVYTTLSKRRRNVSDNAKLEISNY